MTPTKRSIGLLVLVTSVMILIEPAQAAWAYSVSLGWGFWSVTLTGLGVFAQIVLWMRQDKRGLLYWIGAGLIATDSVVAVLPGLVRDLAEEFGYRVRIVAEKRMAEVQVHD